VQENHEAYISITKPQPPLSSTKHGHIRLLLAESIGEDEYRLEGMSIDTQFSDCFIHVEHFRIGRHVLMVSTEFQ
jgi:hypothetical protein